MGDNPVRKVRKSNFSTDEVDVLVDSVRANYGILYGLNAKRATNRWIRQKAWLDILGRVNGVSVEKRTLQEVKNKWKKCQYALKEKGQGALGDDAGDSPWEDYVGRPARSPAPRSPLLHSPPAAMRRNSRHRRQLYNAYDLDLKKSVVIFAEANGNKEAQARYGISEANIRRWRRLKDDLFGRPRDYDRGNLRVRRRVNYTKTKTEKEEDCSSVDSMPLQERLSKMAAQERIAGQVLKSQPLSPTKLKVTRQAPRALKPPEPPQSPVNEEMCLRWNSHHSNMQTAFPSILSKEQYVDVTLAAEGKTLKCHRLILSSCSPYFEEILSGISPLQHPVLFMKDIPFWILKSLCDFMYAGEVHIFQNKLEELLTVAEALKIKGLAGKSTPPDPQSENKETKKKNSQGKHHSTPIRKHPIYNQNSFESTSQDYDDDLLDPLDLLEPLYEEAAEEKKPAVTKPKENKYQYQPVKKPFGRRLRKRKFSEPQTREPSPPPVFSFRKGTRSRPNVKIPKYYHPDYTNPPKPVISSQTDPLLDVDEIKTEPIDVEDNMIDYSDEDHYMENSLETANCDSPIIITSAKPDKFKKIKLSKPIITEVHSVKETNPPPGGLEVIKLTMPQPEEGDKEEVVPEPEPEQEEPLQNVVIERTEGGVEETEKIVEHEGQVTENGADEEKQDGESEVPVQNIQIESVVSAENGAAFAEEEEEEVKQDGGGEIPVQNLQLENVTSSENGAEEKQDGDNEVPVQVIQIENVRSEQDQEFQEEEERRTASLNHLEKEAMSVADAITMENQTDPPDIEEKV
ncbi:hypothetical protein TcasGA2_TC015970 [Tribolium castaneum]|uniref:Regulatory protein zeste n=2 Tax=Tribolium castaneum TaxID=7070 RepID=A0A139W8K1_TRICA|nr:hypothetical protein TcasGA2_TC015970 [Tribolium castaneum]